MSIIYWHLVISLNWVISSGGCLLFIEQQKTTVMSRVYNLIDLADELHALINSNFYTATD